MKRFTSALLLVAALFSTKAFANDSVEVQFDLGGNGQYQDLATCGANARVKALRNTFGENVLRVCDITKCIAGQTLVNTNRDFNISGDGKTRVFSNLHDASVRNYGDCSDISLPWGEGQVRVKIQSGSGESAGYITVQGI